MSKLEDTNAKTRNQSDRDSPKARIYESFTSPNYIFQNNMCNFVTTQSFDIGTRFQGRAIKFSPPLKTFGQKSHFVVPCLK